MKAIIYRPAKTAMQSGLAGTRHWVLKFEPAQGKTVDSLMGWVGSSDMTQQLHMKFASLEEAVGYAKRHGLPFEVKADHRRKRHLQSYADNFK